MVTINRKQKITYRWFAVDFFSRGLHTCTAVACVALGQLGFLVSLYGYWYIKLSMILVSIKQTMSNHAMAQSTMDTLCVKSTTENNVSHQTKGHHANNQQVLRWLHNDHNCKLHLLQEWPKNKQRFSRSYHCYKILLVIQF